MKTVLSLIEEEKKTSYTQILQSSSWHTHTLLNTTTKVIMQYKKSPRSRIYIKSYAKHKEPREKLK